MEPADGEQRLERIDVAGRTLTSYSASLSVDLGNSSIPFSDTFRAVLSPATRLATKQWITRVVALNSRWRSAGADATRLHLGSGGKNLSGWCNVDLVGSRPDPCWDIRRPLPFPARSIEAAFCEHVIEHLTLSETLKLFCNVRGVLRSGAVFRVGVPDAGRYARSYAGDDGEIERLRPGRPTAMLALAEVFQHHGHVSAWDAETLCLALVESGFAAVALTPPEMSRLHPVPDSPDRADETLYVEAVRP